jgi:DNA replicative helicase MCM subunit Mcm2 (Cdc46/Mcm family)
MHFLASVVDIALFSWILMPNLQIIRYVEYCRVTCKPRLSERAAEMLQNKYIEIRQACTADFTQINVCIGFFFSFIYSLRRK